MIEEELLEKRKRFGYDNLEKLKKEQSWIMKTIFLFQLTEK